MESSLLWSRRVAIAAGACALAGGTITLAGWGADIPRLTDWNNDGISMFPNAALCAAMVGLALLRPRTGDWAARVLGAVVFLIGGLTALEHLSGLDLGIDTILFERDWGQAVAAAPMRMGPPAALSFSLIGAALVLLTFGARARQTGAVLAMAAVAIATLSLTGYLYGATQMYTIPWLTGIARQTASMILMLGIGIIASTPGQEPMRAILARGAAGKLARRGLPLLAVIALALGWVRVVLESHGLVDSALGTALRTLAEMGLLLGLLWGAVVMVRRHEKALRTSREKLRRQGNELSAFFETAAVALHRVSRDGTILWANDAELTMLGYSAEEYIGGRLADFYVDPAELASILGRLDGGEKLVEYETRLRSKDGSIKTVLIDSSVLRDDDGRFLHTQCFTRDITERKKDEEVRSRLAAIVEATDDAIISKTLDGTILSWNRGAERVFGITAAEAVGHSINLIIPPDLMAEEATILEKLRRGEHIQHFETVRVTGQGKRVDISLTISPIRDGSGRIVGASKVARDVTERRRAEKELAEAARRKDEFVAMLAHELRNPLAPLSNALEMLDVVGSDPKQLQSIRAMMQRQLRHMVRLVDDLLDASRISRDKLQLRKEKLELGAVLNEALEACRGQLAGAALELEVCLPEESIQLDADPVRLVQVICNILGNAAKYTERGGKVWLHATREGDHMAAITIRDTGIGIPPEMLSEVFEMFTQVDRSLERMRGGLGIGLSLARRLVELHGGTLTAHSDGIGLGSQFVARFPVLPSTPEARHVEKPEAPNSANNHRSRVLVVDDNRDAATSLALLLELSGSEVDVAYDGLEAVEKAETYMPNVILLDIGLPNLNGYDACREIRARLSGRELYIIALTGWGQDSDRQRSKDAGFDAHMVKPVDYVALTALLDSMQGGRSDATHSSNVESGPRGVS